MARRRLSDTELLAAAAQTVLNDPATRWEECGVWATDGPAVLMDSAEQARTSASPTRTAEGNRRKPPSPCPQGWWEVRACHKTGEFPRDGVVQLLPTEHGPPGRA
ncbi:Imm21 family immunity protein [Streptomyces sp. NPDC032472]|uniref:Imm21 family immunity protein n=1 Tax=Streptomyces sp. NPDC032472 TaxID=3155018 RepID=UPI0033BFC607